MDIWDTKEFEILANGSLCVVEITRYAFKIFRLGEYNQGTRKYAKGALVYEGNYTRWFYGGDPYCGKDNNTVFLQLEGDKYVWIGNNGVVSIKIEEPVKSFQTPLGANLVPYPFVITEKRIYLLAEAVSIDRRFINLNADPYQDYYDVANNKTRFLEVLIRCRGFAVDYLFDNNLRSSSETSFCNDCPTEAQANEKIARELANYTDEEKQRVNSYTWMA